MAIRMEPTRSNSYADFEFSVHESPPALRREIVEVFANKRFARGEPILVVPTFQRTEASLLQWGDAQAKEKDAKLETFLEWSMRVCEKLWEDGSWADVTDPCTGQAYFGPASSAIYADVNANMLLLKYPTEDVGGCRVMRHPVWDFCCYPATLFTTAPYPALLAALSSINAL